MAPDGLWQQITLQISPCYFHTSIVAPFDTAILNTFPSALRITTEDELKKNNNLSISRHSLSLVKPHKKQVLCTDLKGLAVDDVEE